MSRSQLKTPQSLDDARQQIDGIDEQIQALISDRARIAQEVARIKQARGDVGDHYRPAREAEVLRRAMQRNQQAGGGPLTDEVIARLMREIMSACLSLESPLTVAYLGPEGTYTQAAALKHFGDGVTARALMAVLFVVTLASVRPTHIWLKRSRARCHCSPFLCG